jgi:serine phosphatase RsbU (regulator of sigma subunit)
LIYFAFTALFPADAQWILVTSAGIVASYVITSLIHPDPALISNLLYLFQLTFIGVVLNRVLCKLFFDERIARIELRRARDALFAEMEVAQKIQTLLLPREPTLPGYVLAGQMTPASEVGGDYYDVIETRSGRRLIAIGDVSGHGVTTGLTMMMVRASLVSTLESRANATLGELYMAMNRCLCRNLERMDLRLYMTFALLEHDGGGRFRAVGAHLPALVYRAAKRTVEEIEIAGVWLGVIDEVTPDLVPETDFELARGDTMLLLTDGVVEHAGADGMFGFERVQAELVTNADLGPAQVIEALTARLLAHGQAQDDDATLLALKYVGEVDATRVS